VSEEFIDLPPVLAAPPQHTRRRRVVSVVAAHLAVILATAGVVA
jgi:hypothetical protein